MEIATIILLCLIALKGFTETISNYTFHINNSTTELQSFLCQNKTITNNITIIVDSTIDHHIRHGGFCQATGINNTTTMLTIISDSNSQNANIRCIGANNMIGIGTAGFFFHSFHKITLVRLKFSNCGTSFQNSFHVINGFLSQFHFSPYHGTVLIITAVSVVNMQQVIISRYFGFALIAINIPEGIFHNISVLQNSINNSESNIQNGSGMLLMYEDDKRVSHISQMILNVSQSIFQNNHVVYTNAKCYLGEYFAGKTGRGRSKPIISGSAFTIIYLQHIFNVSAIVSNCTFANNSGYPIGNILLLYLNDIQGSGFTMNNSTLVIPDNSNSVCGGSLLYIYIQESHNPFTARLNNRDTHTPVIISDTLFKLDYNNQQSRNEKELNNNAVQLIIKNIHPILIHLKQTRFIQSRQGVLLYSKANPMEFENFNPEILKSVKIVMEGVIAANHEQAGGQLSTSNTGSFIFHGIQNVLIFGNRKYVAFYYNLLGPVIYAINTDVTLEGEVSFIASSSLNGAGINIHNGVLYLKSGAALKFSALRARRKGGAIYISSDSGVKQNTKKMCSLQISNNVSSTFEHNLATYSGTSAFVTNLYRCYMNDTWINESTSVYKKAFKFIGDPNYNYTAYNDNFLFTRNLSTTPKQIQVCSQLDSNKTHYPGETIMFGINTIDYSNNSVHAKISLFLLYVNSHNGAGEKLFWRLKQQDEEKIIQENTNNNCTMIRATILGYKNGYVRPNSPKEIVIFISDDTQIRIPLKVSRRNCPLGFQLNDATQSCECSELLSDHWHLKKCNITSRMIPFFKQVAWIGANKEGHFTVVNYCNTYHCKTIPKKYSFMIKNNTTYISNMKNTVEICQGNRLGVACSECEQNTSVAFGTHECIQCGSKWWILTIFLYLIAGPLLVYILFKFELTLTIGTLNGILTYAHLSNGYLLDSLQQQQIDSQKKEIVEMLANCCHTFLSMLNLNLGFPLCFYDGMDEIWKSGLSLAFPVYLLVIVIALIIASHYSTRFSNKTSHLSVQVLVTVLHISSYKLLLACFDVLSSTDIYVESAKPEILTWRNDARVFFSSPQHLILVTVTITVASVFLVPYMIVLTAGVFLMKHKYIRNYLRPYYEAIHGPYENNKEYWFALRNIMVVMVIIDSASLSGRNQFIGNVTVTPLVIIFLVFQAYAKPYKKNALNILDIIILLNYVLIMVSTWYYDVTTEIWKSKLLTSIMVVMIFVIFKCILLYHIMLSCNQTSRNLLQKAFHRFRGNFEKDRISTNLKNDDDDQLREPLLESFD